MGTGHLWPVLSGEHGEYQIAAGDQSAAGTLLTAMRNMTSDHYLEPEQTWEDPALPASPYGTDPATASIGFQPGQPAGSASPLTWAQAQYARLALDLSAGHNLDTPSIVSDRYVTHGMPGPLPLTVTSPPSGSSVNTPSVTVTGITSPGASVDVEALSGDVATAATASTTAGGQGNWSLSVPASFGATTITVTATLGNSTGYAQLSVTDLVLGGNTVLLATDPTGDDNGPGTYAYPTAPDFRPGAFDLKQLQVNQTATDVYVLVKLANLDPTFGSAFGAQLLDVYIRNPAATATSSAAAFPSRNYTIAPADKWSERVDAEGFAAPVWVDANGVSLGSPQLVVDQASRTATLVLPKAAFGTVAPGWVFTVTLTGQDGFSPGRARAFTPTPTSFTFGVCAPGGHDPICSVDPNTVPKVMDTIPPPGVSQAAELNPTLGPVVLQGFTVPGCQKSRRPATRQPADCKQSPGRPRRQHHQLR